MLKVLLIKSFVSVLLDKSELVNTYDILFKKKTRRLNLLIIVKQDVTEEELDAIIDSDQQNQIFAQSVRFKKIKQNNTCRKVDVFIAVIS